MRQRQNQKLSFGELQEIIELEMTLALPGIFSALAAGEQLAKPAVSGAVARIDQNVRRVVHKDEARTDQKFWLAGELGIAEFLVSPHHAGQRVVIGDADDGKTKLARLVHVILRMRSAAQEREIRGDSDFGIVRCRVNADSHWLNAGGFHANSPCTNQLEG